MIDGIRRTIVGCLDVGALVRNQRLALQSRVAAADTRAAGYSRSLLVDVSIICQGDARTGIQRVVRGILAELQRNPPPGYKVCPVFATCKQDYRHVPEGFSLASPSFREPVKPAEPISVGPDDVFLGLDLATSILPMHRDQLIDWKIRGVKVHVLVYDLLPVSNPEWFHGRTTRNFHRWLKAVAVLADSMICISNTVKAQLERWLATKYGITFDCLPVHSIPMGSDIEATLPSAGLPLNSREILSKLAISPTALMVGTLEPRKGHAKVIQAFERLWKQGVDCQLLIIGKPGWKTRRLQARLLRHKELDRRLFWLKNSSDEFMSQTYQVVYGLISASEGEGFGLPLIEAAKYGKPILARDIPVFRELDLNISFFKCDGEYELSAKIYEWLRQGQHVCYSKSRIKSWQHTVNVLQSLICQDQPDNSRI